VEYPFDDANHPQEIVRGYQPVVVAGRLGLYSNDGPSRHKVSGPDLADFYLHEHSFIYGGGCRDLALSEEKVGRVTAGQKKN
jgi:hypothetical protein